MRFIRDNYPGVIKDSPPRTMAELIVHYKVPPLKLARYCCRDLKERGGKGRFKITGVRAEESARRAKRSQVERGKHGTRFLHVIHKWTTADVWSYIRANNLPYCSLYDEGFQRIGCVLCPFQSFAATQRDLKRFPAIAEYYRRACRKSFEVNRGKFTRKGGVWSSGDDMFNWWINARHGVRIAEDCNSNPLCSEDDGSIL